MRAVTSSRPIQNQIFINCCSKQNTNSTIFMRKSIHTCSILHYTEILQLKQPWQRSRCTSRPTGILSIIKSSMYSGGTVVVYSVPSWVTCGHGMAFLWLRSGKQEWTAQVPSFCMWARRLLKCCGRDGI